MKRKESTRSLSRIKYILLSQFILFSSCDLFNKKSRNEEDKVIASVGKITLKKSEIEFLVNPMMSYEDSSAIVSRYVQSWVKQQLMITEAGKAINFNTPEFDRRLREYKESLMIHEFEKDYLNNNLDQKITTEEVQNYYEQFKDNFILKEIIVRANFIKIDKNSPQKSVIERAIRENKKEQLKELSMKFASNYYLEDDNWISLEELIAGTPLANEVNKVQLLKNSPIIKGEDESYMYYFIVLEYKLQDQVPPVEFVKEEIVKILLNKRVNSLKEQLHKDIFTRALENKAFSIYE